MTDDDLNSSKRLLERAERAEAWADQLAAVVFLALVDSMAHGAEVSGVLYDYREWVKAGRP